MTSGSSGTDGGGGGGDPWAWLGLLKWTLSHQDGTHPSSESMSPMSQEDKEFLEKVMKEGIIDENERMKYILEQFSTAMDYYRTSHSQEQQQTSSTTNPDEESKIQEQKQQQQQKEEEEPISTEDLEDLLHELRDIVENIDWAQAFVAIKGLTYLLGAITVSTTNNDVDSSSRIPQSIRNMCLGILSTLAQNNPPVQKELLEMGAIKTLSDLFLTDNTTSDSTRTKIMQAISATVRNDELTEGVFEQIPQAPALMVKGLETDDDSPGGGNELLRSKTLFFLRAFLTADTATSARARTFGGAITMVTDRPQYLEGTDSDQSLRESSIGLLRQLLERRMAVRLLLERKDRLVSLGVRRISELRTLQATSGDDAYTIQQELDDWESFLILLSRSNPDEGSDT